MLFTCTEDFFAKAAAFAPLSREREKAYAAEMMRGDAEAREKIICSYLPTVAAYVKKCPKETQTLELIYRFTAALEKAVDGFDFLDEREAFSRRLGFALRKENVRYIAESPRAPF